MSWHIGLDLGQQQDYTALVLVEKKRLLNPDWYPNAPVPKFLDEWIYEVPHVTRWPLGTPYPQIVDAVAGLLKRPELEGKRIRLALDCTGVGLPIFDMFSAKIGELPGSVELLPVSIHGGGEEHASGGFYRVPKRELVSRAVRLLQSRELKISPALPHSRTLVEELKSFRLKINTATGHDSYEAWRERDHDDLVLALCIALWAAERPVPELTIIPDVWR